MSKKLELFIKSVLVVSFFVPLIAIPDNYIFPFIVPKIVVFRSLVLMMLGAYILLLFTNWQKYRIKLTAINTGVLVFLFSFTISTIVGVDFYKSFWDCHERMLGLFTIFHYIAYYFIITSVITKWEDWKWIFRIFLGAGFIVMFIGMIQKINPEYFLNKGNNRVSATLGNAIYFSGYGLFLFLLGTYLAIKEKIKKQNFWFWYSAFTATFGFFGIFWGGTRGALLGLMTALLILLVSYILSLKEEKHKKYKYILLACITIGILGLGLSFKYKETNFVRSIPALGRLVNTNISSSNTRIMAWEVAIDAVKEKPIFGWGPNNYYYAFNKYYRPEFLEHGWGETWFDNAHSSIMNTIAVQGLFGILSYLSIFVLTVLSVLKFYKIKEIDKHTAFFGIAIILAHFVSVATVFDNPTSYLYFFCILGFLNSNLRKKEDETIYMEKDFNIPLAVFVTFFVVLFIYSTNINPAKANKQTLLTIKNIYQGGEVVNSFEKAEKTPSPHIDDIRNDFAKIVSENLPNYIKANKIADANKMFDLAFEEEKKNLELHPLDIRVNITLSNLAQVGANLRQDENLLIYADSIMDDTFKYSPKRQQLYFISSALKIMLGKNEEAEILLKQAVELDPKVEEAWWRLAIFYHDLGNNELAKKILAEAGEKYGHEFRAGQSKIIRDIILLAK